MVLVDYSYTFDYRYYQEDPSPILTVELRNRNDDQLSVQQDAFLDSGASRSIFIGTIPACSK